MVNILFLSNAVATTARLVSYWYKEAPSKWKKVIDYKYLRNGTEGEKRAAYEKAMRIKRSRYYELWDEAREDVGRRVGRV